MTLSLLGAPTDELGDGAAAACSEEQDGAAIGGSHLPQLGGEALVIKVALSPTFPRNTINININVLRPQILLGMQLQIELQGIVEALAARGVALTRSGAAAEEGGGEEEEEP